MRTSQRRGPQHAHLRRMHGLQRCHRVGHLHPSYPHRRPHRPKKTRLLHPAPRLLVGRVMPRQVAAQLHLPLHCLRHPRQGPCLSLLARQRLHWPRGKSSYAWQERRRKALQVAMSVGVLRAANRRCRPPTGLGGCRPHLPRLPLQRHQLLHRYPVLHQPPLPTHPRSRGDGAWRHVAQGMWLAWHRHQW